MYGAELMTLFEYTDLIFVGGLYLIFLAMNNVRVLQHQISTHYTIIDLTTHD